MYKIAIAGFAAMILLVGCSAGESEQAGATSSTIEAPASAGSGSTPAKLISNPSQAVSKREVVKKGSLTVQVAKVEEAERKARSLVETAGGRVDRVSSSNLASPDAALQMTLRIPVDTFENVMVGLEKLGVRTQKTVEIEDVTEQAVDLDTRAKNLLAQEMNLRNMLAKAKNLSDGLSIRNDISRLRGEIESMQAQRKSLAGEAAYSHLELNLEQSATAAAFASTDPNWLQGAWAQAWGGGTAVYRTVVGVLMWLLVFSPIWLPGILVIRWAIRTSSPVKVRLPQ